MSAKKVLTLQAAKRFLADQNSVELGKYTSIENDAATALAKYQGNLALRGLRSLEVQAARALSNHRGHLYFDFKRLSDDVAQALSQHRGGLCLAGLKSLTDTAAQYLSRYKAYLSLPELHALSSHAAASLSKNQNVFFPFVLRPEAVAGALEAQGERHSEKRSEIRSKKLKDLQIVLPLNMRPLYQICKKPKLLRHINSHISELQHQCETLLDRMALERLGSYIKSPLGPCASFHFPMPEPIAHSVSHANWKKICKILHEWAVRELEALDTCFVDVENLTESNNDCIGFTSSVFKHRRYVKEDLVIADTSLQWRCIGDKIAVVGAGQIDQYEAPPHELSDLFNRALPPELTMIYFDMGANGLYVLMKTKGMEKRLSKVLLRRFNNARSLRPDRQGEPAASNLLSWLDAASALDPNIETFTRSVEEDKSDWLDDEDAANPMILGVWKQGIGVRVCVNRLSVKIAQLLASFPGQILEIRARGRVSDEAAKALADFQGSQLELKGISGLSENALHVLISSKIRTYLAILKNSVSVILDSERIIAVDFSLSDACFKKLRAYKIDRLLLKGNVNLSDAAANALSSFKGKLLCLDGVTELSGAAATALSKSRCNELQLNGLKKLLPKTAATLAKSGCEILELNGVQSISDSTAKALSAFNGKKRSCSTSMALNLNGIHTLSDNAAKALAKTNVWTLGLCRLKKISDIGIKNIAQFERKLVLGIESISDNAAASFGKSRRNTLHLNALKKISDIAITEIASSIHHELSLNGIKTLSVNAAQALASEPAAQMRASGSYVYYNLHLNGLTTLSVDVAKALAGATASLYLNGIINLGDTEARILAKHKGWGLELNGIVSLTNDAAESLSKYKEELCLSRLTDFSEAAAVALSRKRGLINGELSAEWVKSRRSEA